MLKGIVVGTNTGLGDQIVMNGGIRYLSQCYDKVWLVTWENRAKHAEYLYKDCPNIEVYVKPSLEHSRQAPMRMESAHREIVESHPDFEIKPYTRYWFIKLKEWAKLAKRFELPSNTIFPRIFYARLGVDYSKRYTFQKIPRDFNIESRVYDLLQIKKPYIFVVNDCRSSKFNIDIETDKTIVNPMDYPWWKDTLIYDWQMVMELADEIHTVNTSWFHLARAMQLHVPKFYYSARKVRFCEQNKEFLNDEYDNGWTLVTGDWSSKKKNNWKYT
jgi:hypothetical protein